MVHVLGVNGVIGNSLFRNTLAQDLNWSFSKRTGTQSRSSPFKSIDITRFAEKQFLDEHDLFVIASGISPSKINKQESDSYLKSEIILLNDIVSRGKRFIYFSSSRVAQYLEQGPLSIPTSMFEYVLHKAKVESIFAEYPFGSFLRLGKVVHPKLEYFLQWEKDLNLSGKITASSGVVCEPIYQDDVANVVVNVAIEGITGILEAWSFDSISYFEIARLYLANFHPNRLEKNTLIDSEVHLPGINRGPKCSRITEHLKNAQTTGENAVILTIEEMKRQIIKRNDVYG